MSMIAGRRQRVLLIEGTTEREIFVRIDSFIELLDRTLRQKDAETLSALATDAALMFSKSNPVWMKG